MSTRPLIGVLALQGAFAMHIKMLSNLDVDVIEVRKPEDLEACDGLIIPGGESTTMTYQIKFIKMQQLLQRFAEKKPIFGTCAGLILMSKEVIGGDVLSLNLLDVAVERNAYGRQIESFSQDIELKLDPKKTQKMHAVFIRAPRIIRCGPEVKVLSALEGEPIAVQQGRHIGSSFHPELTQDPSLHKYFIKQI